MLKPDKTLRNFVMKNDIMEGLQKEKDRTGLSMSMIVNLAVKEYLDRSENLEKLKNKKALN